MLLYFLLPQEDNRIVATGESSAVEQVCSFIFLGRLFRVDLCDLDAELYV